jgi:hypothetical protein
MRLLFLTILQLITILYVKGQESTKYNGIEIRLGDSWVRQDNGVPPVNIDTVLFDQTIISKIEYPFQALRMGVEGDVVCTIELDDLGNVVEYSIVKDIGAGTAEAIKNVLKDLPNKWTPAIVDGKSIRSRITLLFNFHLGVLRSYPQKDTYQNVYLIMATGKAGALWKTVNAKQIAKNGKTTKRKDGN